MRNRLAKWLFAGSIFLGAIAFFLLVPLIRDYSCRPPLTAETKDQSTNQTNHASNLTDADYSPKSLFCGETKGTDLALVFFTYCLAIVGWFTLRSSERNLAASERAYIFHGYSPLQFRSNQAVFTLVMINTGRMPGGVKEIGYKFLQRRSLPPNRNKIDWAWDVLDYDFIVSPGQKADVRRFLSLCGDHIFVTYIKYQDLFTKRMHTSGMAMHIYPSRETGERAGGDAWNDWD